MIYLDSSVVLAKLLVESRSPPESLWAGQLTSSRLLEYEVWNRVHAGRVAQKLGIRTQQLLDHIQFIELSPSVLARALQPFPLPLRTLDTLHLTTVEHLRGQGYEVFLASFDARLLAAARALAVPLYEF